MSQFDYSGLCIKQQILAKLAAINMTLNRDPSVFHSEGNLPLNEQIIHAYTQSTVIKLNRILNEREVDLFNNLNLYLSENWALIKGTYLSYTALPEHPITDLLCDVATWTAKIGRDLLPIKLLMPTICIDHAVTDEKNFTAKTDLRVILKTHILGRASHYLIPVNVLTTLPITFNASKIGNPYFDADVHPLESEYWDVDELERLSRHSSFSASIFDLKKQYDDLSQDNSHLFGRISELVRLLTYNSSHGGVGTEEIAGKGAMIAIVDFFEYYDRFADEEKLCIPGAVLRELNLLRDYSVPEADRQIKNLHPLHSCIGTRSVDLLNAMKGVESVLSNITLVGHTKTTLLDKVLRNFNGSKTSLAENLSGNDTLGITKDVIETLNIKLRLQSYDDLKILYQLTAPEIIELCTITGVPEMIVQAIEHIENLVCIFHDLPHEKIMALLRGTGSVLIQSLIRSAKNDLLPLLILRDPLKISSKKTHLIY